MALDMMYIADGGMKEKVFEPSDFDKETRIDWFVEVDSDAAFVSFMGRSAQAKDVYFNTTTKVFRFYDGTQWLNFTNPEDGYIEQTGYTRISTSSFSVTDNATNQSIFKPGVPLRYEDSGSDEYYGIIESYTTGTIVIKGIPLPDPLSKLYVGPTEKVLSVIIQIAGDLAVGDDQLATVMKTFFRWTHAEAYLVRVLGKVETAAVGADLRIAIGVAAAGTDLFNSPVYLNLVQATTEVNSGVNIKSSNYKVSWSSKIFINVDQIGSTTPGSDLTVVIQGVLP